MLKALQCRWWRWLSPPSAMAHPVTQRGGRRGWGVIDTPCPPPMVRVTEFYRVGARIDLSGSPMTDLLSFNERFRILPKAHRNIIIMLTCSVSVTSILIELDLDWISRVKILMASLNKKRNGTHRINSERYQTLFDTLSLSFPSSIFPLPLFFDNQTGKLISIRFSTRTRYVFIVYRISIMN